MYNDARRANLMYRHSFICRSIWADRDNNVEAQASACREEEVK